MGAENSPSKERGARPRTVPDDHGLLEATPRARKWRSVRVQDEEHANSVLHRFVEGRLPRVRVDVAAELVLVVRVGADPVGYLEGTENGFLAFGK